jgi:hypothetical protein
MTSANVKVVLESKSSETGRRPVYSVTAGGYRDLPLTMSLGEYVTITSPLLVYKPVPVLERHFAGGLVPALAISPSYTEGQEQSEEAGHALRLAELYFSTHLPELSDRFEGQFVAIIDFMVVDNDPNLDTLMERVYRKFGYRPILMRQVQKGTDRPSRLPSTKQARRFTGAI